MALHGLVGRFVLSGLSKGLCPLDIGGPEKNIAGGLIKFEICFGRLDYYAIAPYSSLSSNFTELFGSGLVECDCFWVENAVCCSVVAVCGVVSFWLSRC